MPLQATSGAASYDGFGGGVAAVPNYIEECFSTTLYTGNGSTQTITNGIDLAGEGGLVWIKNRTGAISHALIDTARGGSQVLSSDTTSAQANYSPQGISAFDSSGFTVNGAATTINSSSYTYASWTFRKQPKFFDIQTATVGASNTLTFSHSLGSTPGFIMVKSTANAGGWVCYHTSLGNDKILQLQSTSAAVTITGAWSVSSTSVTLTGAIGTGEAVVAYLFAHNAGGFGLTGTDNVISCGSFTTDGSGNASINLGFEAQFVIGKNIAGGNWSMSDNMRGMPQTASSEARLMPNSADAEGTAATNFRASSTGFDYASGSLNATFVYIAIRRGPMKVPTSGTSVFSPIAVNNATGTANTTGFPIDLQIPNYRSGPDDLWLDRLRGISSTSTESGRYLSSQSTAAEGSASFTRNWDNTGFQTAVTYASINMAYWNFRRAPSFFDEVCYTGNSTSGATQTHNLGVVPELMIVKGRSVNANWFVYSQTLGATKYLILNDTGGSGTLSSVWNDTAPTSTTFTLGNAGAVNASGGTYVAYLFATCPGVSKVTSFTGNGSTQTINCGFTSGARFVLIKATSTTGNWLTFDTARGMTTSTDPWLALNSTAAESATTGACTTTSVGFTVDESKLTGVNTNGVSYIVLAVA